MTLLTVEASGILLLCRWGEVVLLSLSLIREPCMQAERHRKTLHAVIQHVPVADT